MKEKNYKKAINIINRETPIINAITLTGFPGYKELMRLARFTSYEIKNSG